MSVPRQQCVYGFEIVQVFTEISQMEFVSIRFSLEQRWDGSAIDKHICLNIAPHLCKPKGENHRATVLYPVRDGLYERTALQSLFQADEVQSGGCVWVVPRGFRQWNNRLARKFCVWIQRPAQFVQH